MSTIINMAAKKEEAVRKRQVEPPSWAPGGKDYDPDLPYGPKVYLARKKKPDPWWVTCIEVRMFDVKFSCNFNFLFKTAADECYEGFSCG